MMDFLGTMGQIKYDLHLNVTIHQHISAGMSYQAT